MPRVKLRSGKWILRWELPRRNTKVAVVITSYSIHYTKLYDVNMAVGGGADAGHRAPDDPLRTADIAVLILLARRAAQLVVADLV